jgi:hypothetical protein
MDLYDAGSGHKTSLQDDGHMFEERQLLRYYGGGGWQCYEESSI